MHVYPPTPAGAAPRSSVHVCSPLSTTRPLPFLQIAIGPRLPHPFYCSGISPPPPGTRRSHSAVLGTTSRPRLLDPFHLSGISMVVELLGTPRHSSALLGTPRHCSAFVGTARHCSAPQTVLGCSNLSLPSTTRHSSALLGTPRHHKPSSVAPPCLF